MSDKLLGDELVAYNCMIIKWNYRSLAHQFFVTDRMIGSRGKVRQVADTKIIYM